MDIIKVCRDTAAPPVIVDSTMTGDETISYAGINLTIAILNPSGNANRDYDPTGTWPEGTRVHVINTSSSNSVLFDTSHLNTTVATASLGMFYYCNSSWR